MLVFRLPVERYLGRLVWRLVLVDPSNAGKNSREYRPSYLSLLSNVAYPLSVKTTPSLDEVDDGHGYVEDSRKREKALGARTIGHCLATQPSAPVAATRASQVVRHAACRPPSDGPTPPLPGGAAAKTSECRTSGEASALTHIKKPGW
jgi:hypothetical protein